MEKKLLFLDGDGTLWYPSSTKRTRKPHWIYLDETTKDDYLKLLELTPGTKKALQHFYKKGVLLVVISANPHDEATAIAEITARLQHFKIETLFYAVRASNGNDPNGKTAVMLEIISKLGLSEKDALMVGDSYSYDYLAAKNASIDAFFIENTISKMPETLPGNLQSIKEIHDLITILK